MATVRTWEVFQPIPLYPTPDGSLETLSTTCSEIPCLNAKALHIELPLLLPYSTLAIKAALFGQSSLNSRVLSIADITSSRAMR